MTSPRHRLSTRTIPAAVFVLALGAATAAPAVASPGEVIVSEPRTPAAQGGRTPDPVAGIRPDALVTTGVVLALVMGATAGATTLRARRRASD